MSFLSGPFAFPLGGTLSASVIARIVPGDQEVVVGSVAKLDGRTSTSAFGPITRWFWSFSQVPIGSQITGASFTNVEEDGSVVGFAPDVTGTYKATLYVGDGTFTSAVTEAIIDVRVILVPYHKGIVPDASFIWNYLSDFWSQVADRGRFETFWSASIQLVSSEMLKLYQYQYNKSIRDIQDLIQKRWIPFSPSLDIDRTSVSFILADDVAGTHADTSIVSSVTGLVDATQPTYSNGVTVPVTEGNFVTTAYGQSVALGKLLTVGNRAYTLARANNILESLDHHTDGATSGTNQFAGTGFSSGMVGATLRIIGPAASVLRGDYTIATYVDSGHVTISNPPTGVTWSGSSSLEYTILPASASHSTFFADRVQVPTGLTTQPWRLSSTLISSDVDFEAQGVMPGDTIEVEVTRLDLQVLSTFFAQVVSVDRKRVGFVLNLADLVAGTAAGGLTTDIQVTLATDLIVPGLSTLLDGTFVYGLDALKVKDTITSIEFKRTYFERELTTDDEIDVGPFSISARPVRIIRNKKIAVDPTMISAPILQEYIKQPDIIRENGLIYFASGSTRTLVAREPYVLSENLDYVLDDESTINGTCSVTQGNTNITIPLGDLIDRSVQEGDTLEVAIGATSETYTIVKVLAADTVNVTPLPTITAAAALYTIRRRIQGKFLRFVNSIFTKTSPAPQRLWAEVVYFDNGDAIEGNFGILVGVKREDLDKIKSGIPYRSAVAGLMSALSTGPTIANLELSAQILLGLPFATNSGVITEISPSFKKRVDGSPLYGRLLIQGRDRDGNSTGVTYFYLYPQGSQLFDSGTSTWLPVNPTLSGLAINPETGVEYVVGDEVAQFAPLSKGVQIQEYLSTPDWVDRLVAQGDIAQLLQKYHSFQLLVNSDLVAATDINIADQFMQKVKAHYVRLSSSIFRLLIDNVTITDDFWFVRTVNAFDNTGMGTPTAFRIDGDHDENKAFISTSDGVMYSRYLSGSDLVTTYGSSNVSSATGGFLTGASWDGPLIRPGDVLQIIGGANAGKYPITAVGSGTGLTLNLGSTNLQTLTGQLFFIFRPIQNPIWIGKAAVVNGNATVTMTELDTSVGGIGTAGVSVGDTLVFADLTTINSTVSRRYTINEVDIASPALLKLTKTINETTGSYTAWIVREGLVPQGPIVPPGSSGENFYANLTTSADYIVFNDTVSHSNSWLNLAMLRPGSYIYVDTIPYEVLRFEPASRQALVTPPLLTTATDKQVTVQLRPSRSTTVVSADFLDRFPSDYLELDRVASLSVGDHAVTTASSKDVTLSVETPSNLTRPGDLLVLLAGADSTRDVGFGTGAFPIHQINSGGTVIHLMDALTATGNFQYSLRRRVPNEG